MGRTKIFSKCNYIAFSLLLSPFLLGQKIEWQQVLGGIHSEYLYDIKATPDYGFLLAGSSYSSESGNKTTPGMGGLDYFLWKMDESGRMEWQKSYGSAEDDYLYEVSITKEGGFILGGSSQTLKEKGKDNADKFQNGYGNMDFWIIKLDPTGKEEWQLTLGGIGNDQLQCIQQTPDGGYIIGGSSDSAPYYDENGKLLGNKVSPSYGSNDYWVIKLTSVGEVEWEKSFGGKFSDQLNSIVITEDGYLIGGTSNSVVSGNKKVETVGQNDFWVIKLNEHGEEQWQQVYGGDGDDTLVEIIKTEKGYLLAGNSNSNLSETKKSNAINGFDFWVMEIDEIGEMIWDNTYDVGEIDKLVKVLKIEDDHYLIGGYSQIDTQRKSATKGIDDYVVLKVNPKGELIWNKSYGGNEEDHLRGMVETRDGGVVIAGNSNSKKSDDKDRASIGGNDYWVIKLGTEKKKEERDLLEVYPNPTYQYTNIIIGKDFQEAELQVFNMNGQRLQGKKIQFRSTPVDLQGYPPGIYLMKVLVDGESFEIKVVKKGSY